MRIIDATVTAARRCRDFDRVEARVRIRYRSFPGGPWETRTVLTSVAAGPGLRARLLADAGRLAALTEPVPMAEAA